MYTNEYPLHCIYKLTIHVFSIYTYHDNYEILTRTFFIYQLIFSHSVSGIYLIFDDLKYRMTYIYIYIYIYISMDLSFIK